MTNSNLVKQFQEDSDPPAGALPVEPTDGATVMGPVAGGHFPGDDTYTIREVFFSAPGESIPASTDLHADCRTSWGLAISDTVYLNPEGEAVSIKALQDGLSVIDEYTRGIQELSDCLILSSGIETETAGVLRVIRCAMRGIQSELATLFPDYDRAAVP